MSKQASPVLDLSQESFEAASWDETITAASLPEVKKTIAVRSPVLPLNTAVQFFSTFNRTSLPPEEFASVVLNLASGLKEEGHLGEAEELYWRVIEHQRDRNDPEALTSMNNVAVLLQAQGKLAEAESLLRQTLEQLKARFGADHGNFLRSQNSLGCLLQNQGKYPEARRLYLQTVETQRRVLGSDHLDTIATLEKSRDASVRRRRTGKCRTADARGGGRPPPRLGRYAYRYPAVLQQFIVALAKAGQDRPSGALVAANLRRAEADLG